MSIETSAATFSLGPAPSLTKSVPSSLGAASMMRSNRYSRPDNHGEMMNSDRAPARARVRVHFKVFNTN